MHCSSKVHIPCTKFSFLSTVSFTPEKEVTGEIPKAQSAPVFVSDDPRELATTMLWYDYKHRRAIIVAGLIGQSKCGGRRQRSATASRRCWLVPPRKWPRWPRAVRPCQSVAPLVLQLLTCLRAGHRCPVLQCQVHLLRVQVLHVMSCTIHLSAPRWLVPLRSKCRHSCL